jgi:cell division protein ZapA
MSNNTVFVKILDKDYQVVCPPDERAALIESARILDERMRIIRGNGSTLGLERIAVMAALNLSHDLLKLKQTGPAAGGASTVDLARLNSKLDRCLGDIED